MFFSGANMGIGALGAVAGGQNFAKGKCFVTDTLVWVPEETCTVAYAGVGLSNKRGNESQDHGLFWVAAVVALIATGHWADRRKRRKLIGRESAVDALFADDAEREPEEWEPSEWDPCDDGLDSFDRMPGDGDFNEIFADDDLDDLWQRPAAGGCAVLERRPKVRQKSIPRHAPRPILAPAATESHRSALSVQRASMSAMRSSSATRTGQETGRIERNSPVCSVAYSPDGKKLAAGCLDGEIRLWDVGIGTQ